MPRKVASRTASYSALVEKGQRVANESTTMVYALDEFTLAS
jgi:hypothetical protein